MNTCNICGAPMEAEACPFNVDKEDAPWLNDYVMMANGEMTHEQHQLFVARWNLHHRSEISPKVRAWTEDVVRRSE